MQNIPEDPDYEPWREQALERGYRSSAAVPLIHGDTCYGVLNVYADRTQAFDDRERELLSELGDDIAHAVYQADIRETSRRYERVIENLPVGVYRTTADPDGEIMDANPALATILGADSADELAEHPARSFYRHPEDRDGLRRDLEQEGVVREREVQMVRLDGEGIWASLTVIRREGEKGTVFEGILRDITKRKRRERRLAEQKERYRTLCEQTPDMVLVHDADGVITQVNQQLCETLGYDREDVLGRTIWDIDESADRTRSTRFWENLEGRERPTFEGTFRSEDDRSIPVEIRLRRLDIGDEEYLAIARDISRREKREEQLEAQAAELERQNERLREFADVLAHDIPNHLGVAAGYLELARDTGESTHFDRIEQAHDRIESLIESMRTAVRTGEPVGSMEWIDLEQIVGDCWNHCCPGQSPQSVDVESSAAIRADPDRFGQAFENLFWNACEYGGSDVTIRVGRLEDGFFVEDDGPGIPDELRERVFAPGVTTPGSEHTGLGLTIVREIADAHGWEVTVGESDAGGARFEFHGVAVRPSNGTE